MTEPDIDAIRARHQPKYLVSCQCGAMWPCDAVRLCDEVEHLRGPRLTPDEAWEIARAKWQQDMYRPRAK